MLSLKIRTDNAAFEDDSEDIALGTSTRNAEVARILREVAEAIESGDNVGGCRDVNGNSVGSWSLT